MKRYLTIAAIVVLCMQFFRVALPPGNADLLSIQILAYDLSHGESRFLYPGKDFSRNDAWVEHHEQSLQRLRVDGQPNWCFYPPLIPFLFTPIAGASVETWRLGWAALQISLAAVFGFMMIALVRRHAPPASVNRLLVFAVAFAAYPVARSFQLGQTSLLLAVLVWWPVVHAKNSWLFPAVGRGLSVFVKPFLALAELPNILRGQVRSGFGILGVYLLLGIVSLMAVGAAAHRDYLDFLLTLSSSQTSFQGNQSLLGAWSRLTTDFAIDDYGFELDPSANFIGKLVLLAVLGIALWASLKRRDAERPLSTGMWLSAVGLGLPISWEHHLVFVLPALVLCWGLRRSVLQTTLLTIASVMICLSFEDFYGNDPAGRVTSVLPAIGNLVLFGLLVWHHVRSKARFPNPPGSPHAGGA